MKHIYFTLITSVFGLVSGCAGLQTYHSDLDNNLQLSAQAESGSILSGVRTAVEIHKVNPDCTTEYAGTIKLDDSVKGIGIPTGRSTYLVFTFDKGGLFSSQSSSISYDTLIRPRAGYQYTAQASYQDDLYNVVLSEIDPGNKKKVELVTRSKKACRPI